MNDTGDFDAWLDQAWDEHATDAAAVAARLDDAALARAATDTQRAALGRLVQHVFGEHLGRWADARARLALLSAGTVDAASAATLRVLDASLAVAGGQALPTSLGRPERVRTLAFAAANLAGHDAVRAASLLREAAAEAESAELPDDDPALRAVAINANNVAASLGDKAERSDAERELMILGARTSRRFWARAGGWLETERAEYRLAMSWLQAGDLAQAHRHARECLEIVRAHDGAALEVFFAWEALGRVERAAGNAAGHAQALAEARTAFEALDTADQGWCRESLERLAT